MQWEVLAAIRDDAKNLATEDPEGTQKRIERGM
jgi:hypothetical protein